MAEKVNFTLTCPPSSDEESTLVEFTQSDEEDKEELLDVTDLILPTQPCVVFPSAKTSPEQAIASSLKEVDQIHQLAVSLKNCEETSGLTKEDREFSS